MSDLDQYLLDACLYLYKEWLNQHDVRASFVPGQGYCGIDMEVEEHEDGTVEVQPATYTGDIHAARCGSIQLRVGKEAHWLSFRKERMHGRPTYQGPAEQYTSPYNLNLRTRRGDVPKVTVFDPSYPDGPYVEFGHQCWEHIAGLFPGYRVVRALPQTAFQGPHVVNDSFCQTWSLYWLMSVMECPLQDFASVEMISLNPDLPRMILRLLNNQFRIWMSTLRGAAKSRATRFVRSSDVQRWLFPLRVNVNMVTLEGIERARARINVDYLRWELTRDDDDVHAPASLM